VLADAGGRMHAYLVVCGATLVCLSCGLGVGAGMGSACPFAAARSCPWPSFDSQLYFYVWYGWLRGATHLNLVHYYPTYMSKYTCRTRPRLGRYRGGQFCACSTVSTVEAKQDKMIHLSLDTGSTFVSIPVSFTGLVRTCPSCARGHNKRTRRKSTCALARDARGRGGRADAGPELRAAICRPLLAYRI
jgi:hypothetical protein